MGHRQQLQRGNPQMAQVIHHNRMAKGSVSPAQRFRNFRMSLRQSSNVRLVNHRIAPGRARGDVAFPVEVFRHHQRFRRHGGAVLLVRLLNAAVETRVVCDLAFNRAGAGIDQQLGGIKAVPALWRPGAVDAEAVALTRF